MPGPAVGRSARNSAAASSSGPQTTGSKVVWYYAALAYIFWPISIIAVVVWVLWARMQGGRK